MRLIVLRSVAPLVVQALLSHALIRMPTRRFWCSEVSRRSMGPCACDAGVSYLNCGACAETSPAPRVTRVAQPRREAFEVLAQ